VPGPGLVLCAVLESGVVHQRRVRLLRGARPAPRGGGFVRQTAAPAGADGEDGFAEPRALGDGAIAVLILPVAAQGFTGVNCSTECNGGAFNPCSYNGDCNMDGCAPFSGSVPLLRHAFERPSRRARPAHFPSPNVSTHPCIRASRFQPTHPPPPRRAALSGRRGHSQVVHLLRGLSLRGLLLRVPRRCASPPPLP
jgi:hypothetical protein